MKNAITVLLACITGLLLAGPVRAGPVAELKVTLAATRQHTMAMMCEDDRTALEMLHDEALRASKDLDALLAAALENESLRAAQPTLAQFKVIWEACCRAAATRPAPWHSAFSRPASGSCTNCCNPCRNESGRHPGREGLQNSYSACSRKVRLGAPSVVPNSKAVL